LFESKERATDLVVGGSDKGGLLILPLRDLKRAVPRFIADTKKLDIDLNHAFDLGDGKVMIIEQQKKAFRFGVVNVK